MALQSLLAYLSDQVSCTTCALAFLEYFCGDIQRYAYLGRVALPTVEYSRPYQTLLEYGNYLACVEGRRRGGRGPKRAPDDRALHAIVFPRSLPLGRLPRGLGNNSVEQGSLFDVPETDEIVICRIT